MFCFTSNKTKECTELLNIFNIQPSKQGNIIRTTTINSSIKSPTLIMDDSQPGMFHPLNNLLSQSLPCSICNFFTPSSSYTYTPMKGFALVLEVHTIHAFNVLATVACASSRKSMVGQFWRVACLTLSTSVSNSLRVIDVALVCLPSQHPVLSSCFNALALATHGNSADTTASVVLVQ